MLECDLKTIQALIITAIAVVSFMNAGNVLRQFYHTPVFQHDDMWYREASLERAKKVLQDLGSPRVGYLSGPGINSYDVAVIGIFFQTQYLLAPTGLHQNSAQEEFILVNFGIGKQSSPMPGHRLVEDFGNGLALFRRDP